MEEKTEIERRQPFDVAEAVTEGTQTVHLGALPPNPFVLHQRV